MKEQLTEKQEAVLNTIVDYVNEKQYGPSVRDICHILGLSSPSTVHTHLKTLEQKGYIVRDPKLSRSITLSKEYADELYGSTTDTSTDISMINIPLVGDIAAGQPILAEQNITDSYSLPRDIVGDSASFMLSVHGESMIDVGIYDGDYIVVKEQPVADNGDIVVALIEDEATVKTFYKENDHIRLQPENASMDPIIVKDCAIAGKVVAVIRRM